MPSINYDVRINATKRVRINKCEGQTTLIVQSQPAPGQWIVDQSIAITEDKIAALVKALQA
jgi:hypothetical protein